MENVYNLDKIYLRYINSSTVRQWCDFYVMCMELCRTHAGHQAHLIRIQILLQMGVDIIEISDYNIGTAIRKAAHTSAYL